MAEARIRFHLSLDLLLPHSLRGQELPAHFTPGDTLKNLIEARGIPHTEVDSVTVNEVAVPLSRQVRHGDRISVYPHPTDVGGHPEEPRFLLDLHLGKLARDLRALGFDAAWSPPFDDEALAERAGSQGRSLLTRDRGLLMRRAVVAGYLVRSRQAREQLTEVVGRFGLEGRMRPFSRCLRCNSELVELPREEARAEVPELVFDLYGTFRRCPSCRKAFWNGTHWQSMVQRLGPILGRGE